MKSNKIALVSLLAICMLFILPNSVNGEEWLNSAYDGREKGIMTPVKDQGNTNLCWAYAAIGAAEASLLKSEVVSGLGEGNILSPTQLGYACHNRGSDPLQNTSGVQNDGDYRQSQGSSYYPASLFSQWCGPAAYGLADDCNGWENAKFCLDKAVYINVSDLKNSEQDRLEIKKAIVKYGAVTFSYNNASENDYYNPSNETGSSANPHACVIIGWDDKISSSRFLPGGASQNGGWLVKNSYLSLPYFYLSYDNSSSNIYAFSFAEREKYDNNYFYDSDVADFGVGSLLKLRSAANIFEAKKGEKTKKESVAAVNVGVDGNNAMISVKVYTDLKNISEPTSGVLAATGFLETEYPGYYTIELSNEAVIEKGGYFSVVAEISGENNAYFKLTQNTGQSFANRGGGWSKSLGVPRIKAYTKMLDKELEFLNSKVVLNKDKEGVLITACYDGKGLNAVKIFKTEDSTDKQFDIPSGWEKKKGRRLKAMLWNSLEEMIPICAEEIRWE